MKKNLGFTLIEMVVVIFLVAMTALVVSTLFIGQNRIYRVQTAELNVTSDARVALDDIDNYVRITNRTLGSYSTYTAGPQVLILQIQSINNLNRLIPATFDTVVYYLDGTNLFREIFPDASSIRVAGVKKLASNVNSISFTYNNASFPAVTEVTTDITIQENAGIQNRAITLSTKSTLRNY